MYDEQLEQDFISKHSKKQHWQKHKEEFPNISEQNYQERANKLANSPVDNKTIVGYTVLVTSHGEENTNFVKYNKNTQQFVVYFRKGSQPAIITFYTKDSRQYESKKYLYITNQGTPNQKRYEYDGELPAEQIKGR